MALLSYADAAKAQQQHELLTSQPALSMGEMDVEYEPFLLERSIAIQKDCNEDTSCQIRRSYEFLGGLYSNSLRHPYARTAPISELDDWTLRISGVDDRASIYFEDLLIVDQTSGGEFNLFEETLNNFTFYFHAGNLTEASKYKKALDRLYTRDTVSFTLALHDHGPPAALNFSILHKGQQVGPSQQYQISGSGNTTYFTKRYTIRRFWGQDHLYIPQ